MEPRQRLLLPIDRDPTETGMFVSTVNPASGFSSAQPMPLLAVAVQCALQQEAGQIAEAAALQVAAIQQLLVSRAGHSDGYGLGGAHRRQKRRSHRSCE